MNKSALAAAIGLAVGGASFSAYAALTTSSVLAFNPGNTYVSPLNPGNFPTAASAGASWFSMGSGLQIGYTGIKVGTDGGIHIGVPQPIPADVASHGSFPYGNSTDVGAIDSGWAFYSNTGLHFTNSAIVVVNNDVNSDGGFTKTLNFSGWNVTWNSIPAINMGGGIQVVPGTGTKPATTYNNGTGLATITCSTASCSASSTFTLDYSAKVPKNDPSGFGQVPYSLHLTGHVQAVPVPAAAWLFGSGLMGLAAIARRKKKA